MSQKTAKIGVIMGSDSDMPVMKDALEILESFAVPHEVNIVSAHRTPRWLYKYASEAEERGLQVIIAGAGGAAHLPGMAAALTVLPVIGVPVRTSNLQGLDSLLSIVQMPGGIPVAAVAINQAKNAALLAVSILAATDAQLRKRLHQFREEQEAMVMNKNQKLNQGE